jgi:hypothetical protein
VQRDTVFHYGPGRVVHEVTDPAGNVYVLFSFDLALSATIDLNQVDALAGLPVPPGWSYSSRVLESELLVVSNGLASLFIQGLIATYQRIETVAVDVDIRPFSSRNRIRPGSRGVVPVSILGSEDFDALTVDEDSVLFGPDEAEKVHKQAHVEDVDDDGDLDLLLHFRTQDTGVAPGDTEACVTGLTLAGVPFEGCDSVTTVPPQ